MRKNAKARKWISKKIGKLESEGYPHNQSVAVALQEARYHRLINDGEIEELRDELEDAQEVATGFHGRDLEGEFNEIEHHQFRAELASLGELVELEIYSPQLDELVVLNFDRDNPVRLGASGDRKQLFLVGGDTRLDDELLEKLCAVGCEKDKVPLGYAYSVSYFADKHHLTGPKQQKSGTEYIHEFGEQTGKRMNAEQKLYAGKLPELIYDRLNCSLELVGGGYEIRDEGIWD